MDRARALAVLGVAADAPLADVRRRYLELLRAHHPDVAAADSDVDAALVTEAFRVLRDDVPDVAPASGAARDATIAIELPADEAFLVLLDAADAVGSVTYVDADAGLFEVLVDAGGATCSIVVSLQGRATGITDAFCTVEVIAGGPMPDPAALISELAEVVEGILNSGSTRPT